jgi:hypothetical protein
MGIMMNMKTVLTVYSHTEHLKKSKFQTDLHKIKEKEQGRECRYLPGSIYAISTILVRILIN